MAVEMQAQFGGSMKPKDEAAQKLYVMMVMTLSDVKDADIKNDDEAYYKNTIWGLQLTMEELDQEPRIAVQNEIKKTDDMIRELKDLADSGVNADTCKREMRRLWKRFADANRFYIVKGINKSGIRKIVKDGVIDFEETSLEQVTTAVRNNSGVIAGLKEAGIIDGNTTTTPNHSEDKGV